MACLHVRLHRIEGAASIGRWYRSTSARCTGVPRASTKRERERFDARLIYDCMDDWPKWLSEPRPGSFSLSEEVKLVGESDIVVVTARELRLSGKSIKERT